jgi:hypothetical protein
MIPLDMRGRVFLLDALHLRCRNVTARSDAVHSLFSSLCLRMTFLTTAIRSSMFSATASSADALASPSSSGSSDGAADRAVVSTASMASLLNATNTITSKYTSSAYKFAAYHQQCCASGAPCKDQSVASGQAWRLCENILTERDGRKGPPAGNKARCDHTNTPHSKAMQREAKPNQKPQTHTRGARQAQTTSAEGRARPRIGVRPAARVATYAPDRHRDALPRQRATLSSQSAPEMKAARERPGPPACTAGSAKSPSIVRARAPRRPKDSTDIGTKGRAEDTCRYARRLEA